MQQEVKPQQQMSNDIDQYLKEIADAPDTGSGNFIKDGKGRLVVLKAFIYKGFKGTRFIAEFKVLSSQKIPVESTLAPQDFERQFKYPPPPGFPKLDIEPNATGTTCSFAVPLGDPKIPSGPANVRAFVLALFGKNGNEVSPSEFQSTLKDLVSSANPARGLLIDYETQRKAKKNGREELVLPIWTHVKGSFEGQPEMLKQLDG